MKGGRVFVAEQTRAHPHVALMHDPTISVEGNGFLFTEFQPWLCWEHSCLELCSPTRPNTSLDPHQAISQKHAQKFPISLFLLKPAVPTVFLPTQNLNLWVSESSSSHSRSLLDLRYVVLSFHVVVQKNTCRITLDHGGLESREPHIPREWLLCMSFREVEICDSAFLVTVQFTSKHPL